MKRSLLAFQALLASSAILCQTAEASATYSAPDQLHNSNSGLANSLESRINAVREGAWSSLLNSPELDGDLVAKSKWGNGGGHKFKNSRGSGKWKNGKGDNKWSNSRRTWGNGGYHGGWRNGGGAWGNGGGGFVNW